jgi:hypothetical protein
MCAAFLAPTVAAVSDVLAGVVIEKKISTM